ncbi:MAG: hypothetical protein ACMXX7_01460 [Candidatus Woesearchaeota archaeon]
MKKGQITLFVILGLIVVLMVAIGLYFVGSQEVDSVPEQRVFSQTYDARLSAIVSEVEFCMETLAKESLTTIGLQSGFKDVSGRRYGYDMASMNNAIQLFEGSNQIIPYWYYFNGNPSCTSCEFQLNYPFLEGPISIQQEVQDHIQNNLLGCVNNFENSRQLFNVDIGDIDVEVSFNEEDTFIGVEWPLEFTSLETNDVVKANLFSKTLELRFKDIYQTAINILFQLLINQNALEEFAINVADYVSLGGEIPPTTISNQISLSPDFNYWLRSDTERILRSEFADNINFMQIEDSYEYNIILEDDLLRESIYSRFVYGLRFSDYIGNLRVRFNYFEDWPIYLNINPSNGELIFPDRRDLNLLFIRMTEVVYDFDYNIKLPVLITLEDDTAFGGEGFTFRFGSEANVFRGRSLDADIIELQDSGEVGFGDLSQATIPVNVTTKNGYDNSPVELMVEYECIDQTVFVGKTQTTAGIARVESSIPPCIDGAFIIRNDTYFANPYRISVLDKTSVDLEVYPKKNLTFDLRKKVFDKFSFVEDQVPQTEWTFSDQFISPRPDEEVVLMLNSVDDDGELTGIINIIQMNRTTGYSGNVELAPGKYQYFVINTLNMGEGYELPYFNTSFETFTIRTGGILGIGATRERVNINATQINDTMFMGYVSFSEENGFLEITPEDLVGNSHVDLYYAGYRLEDVVYTRELAVLGEVSEASVVHREKLLPEFS